MSEKKNQKPAAVLVAYVIHKTNGDFVHNIEEFPDKATARAYERFMRLAFGDQLESCMLYDNG